ncbi:MauE/DoxX family redox-associated membrane protein [Acidobacteriota bacterium]
MLNNRYLHYFFRLIVGGVFIWAGIIKITNPLGFAQDIANYQIFPQSLSFFLALVLPWIEVICGVFVLTGFFLRSSSAFLGCLLAGFLVLIIVTLIRGIDVECGCFGSLGRRVDYKLLLTDSALLFFSLNIFFFRKSLPK